VLHDIIKITMIGLFVSQETLKVRGSNRRRFGPGHSIDGN
jgi:hypothetical protein